MRKLNSVLKIDLSKNGIRCTKPSDFTGLPREMSQLTNLHTLIVSECNMPYIPPVIWQISTLKYLDISRNKINILVPEVGNLMNLKTLNLQQTNIATLPPEIAFCQDLEELYLWGNVIESLPETLREMPALKVFASNHRSFCSLVDKYMENLLKKGQIQSEHIPPVLFEMPALEKLDLEATKINCLPDAFSSDLQELYLNKNFFLKMPKALFMLTSLKILDISDNDINEIPEEIWKMKSLTSVNFDNNDIGRIPASIGQLAALEELSCSNNKLTALPNAIGKLGKLKSLILDGNQITSLPDTICDLVELNTLDLTGNKIAKLPLNLHQLKNITVAHSYYKLSKHGLWLHQNPLTSPPPHVWKTDNPSQIFQYLKKMQIMQTKNLQRQKIYLFGESQCGKTSLMRTFLTGKSSLTESMTDSTTMLEYTIWRTENNVQFLVHDFGGADNYKPLHHMFLDPKGLYLIVYDHRKYTAQNHYKAIGYWLDLLQIYVPGAVVCIVGTHCDLCYDDFIEKTLQVVKEQIKQQLNSHMEKLEETKAEYEQLLSVEDKSLSEEQLTLQCKKINYLLNSPLKYDGEIHLVNSAEGIFGIPDLITSLEMLTVNKEIFPHAQRFVPEQWTKLRYQIKKEKKHFLLLEDVEKLANNFHICGESFTDCLKYLYDIGEILVFPNHPLLRDLVFHHPRHLVEILTGLFQHGLEKYLDFDENKVFRSKGLFTREIFTDSKQNLLQYGYVSRQMLQCLWFYLQLDYENFNLLLDLLPKFDLCYSIPQPDLPPQREEQLPLVIIPHYNRDPSPTDKSSLWPEDSHLYNQCMMTFTFPIHLPHGLYEQFLCRIQDSLLSRMDYRDATTAEIDKGYFIAYCELDEHSYDLMVKMGVRSTDGGYARRTTMGFSDLFSNLLKDCPGAIWKTTVNT